MKKIDETETVAEPASEPAPNPVQMVNLIGNAVDNKPGDFAATFDQLMKDRISQKVADRKVELSQALFGAPDGLEDQPDEPEVEEPDEEPEVKEPDENGEPLEEPDEEDDEINDEPDDDELEPETATAEETEDEDEALKAWHSSKDKRRNRREMKKKYRRDEETKTNS